MADQTLKFRALLDDKVTAGLLKIKNAADRLGGKGTSASFFGNLSATAVSKGFGLIDSAISGTIGILGDATQAAIVEEQSIAKLDAALKANVKSWDGDRTAIEKVLASRMRLGFSDDEQRESLALLVAATKDETKALDAQRTAMDLARLKGISLKEASEALVKVEGGQFRMLKSLGIVLKEGATAQDALNAVQKIATGQGEAYAETTGGKMLAAQIKVGEAMEKLGEKILPMVAASLGFLADVVVNIIGLLEDLGIGVKVSMEDLEKYAANGSQAAQSHLRMIAIEAAKVPPAMKFMADKTKDDLELVEVAMRETAAVAVAIAAKLPEDIAAALREKRSDWQSAIDLLASDIENEMTVMAEAAAIRAELAGENIAAGLKSKDPVVRAQTQATVAILQTRLAELTEDARTYGQNTAINYANGLRSKITYVTQAGKTIANEIARYLKTSSPAKAGPLSELGGPEGWGERIGAFIAKGLDKTLPDMNAMLGNGPSLAVSGGPGITSSRAPSPASGLGRGPIYLVLPNGKVLAEVVRTEEHWATPG